MVKKKGGRPKGTPKTGGRQKGTLNKGSGFARELAQKYGPDAIRKAAEMAGLITQTVIIPNALGDGEEEKVVPIGMAINEGVRMSALTLIVDRAYGKPTQPISGDDDMPAIRAALKVAFVSPKKPPPIKR